MDRVRVDESHGGSSTTGERRFTVYVDGEMLRNGRGIGRRFKTAAAARLAGENTVAAMEADRTT